MRPTTTSPVDDFIDMIDHVADLTGSTDAIGIGTDMSLGSYPLREEDPWGAPDYGKPFAEYGEKVTADPRSPRRNLDGFSDYAEVVEILGGPRGIAATPGGRGRSSERTTFRLRSLDAAEPQEERNTKGHGGTGGDREIPFPVFLSLSLLNAAFFP
jgi:hypothetical protein